MWSVTGKNALEVLGFQITQADGTAVVPDRGVKQVRPSSEGNIPPSMLQIGLVKELHLGPHETRVVKAKVSQHIKGVAPHK